MNKNFLSSLILAGALTVGSLNAQTFSGGTGSQSDPYLISNIDDWNELRDSVESNNNPSCKPCNWSYGKYFELIQDIADTIKVPIGKMFLSYSPNQRFEGTLNGNGFSLILGMSGGGDYGGLFRVLHYATISNLVLKGYVRNYDYAMGSIVGEMKDNTSIINCISYCEITTDKLFGNLGGFVGYASSSNLINNIFVGTISVVTTVKVSSFHLGGIVAYNATNSVLLHNLNLGNIFLDVPNAFMPCNIGGIAGFSAGIENKIISSKNAGFVKSNKTQNHNVGGIVGAIGAALISDNINVNVVEGHPDNTGCIVGKKPPTVTTVINNHYDKQMCGE